MEKNIAPVDMVNIPLPIYKALYFILYPGGCLEVSSINRMLQPVSNGCGCLLKGMAQRIHAPLQVTDLMGLTCMKYEHKLHMYEI